MTKQLKTIEILNPSKSATCSMWRYPESMVRVKETFLKKFVRSMFSLKGMHLKVHILCVFFLQRGDCRPHFYFEKFPLCQFMHN